MSETMAPVKILLTPAEAAYALGATVSAVGQWKRDGDLNATYIDSKPRYLVDEVERFARAGKATPPA